MVKICYYLLGENQILSPLKIEVDGLNLAGYKIKARTYTENGSKIYIYYNDKKIDCYTYKRENFPTYETEMACDIYQSIFSPSINLEDSRLFELAPLIIDKCELHQGVHIPQYKYEVIVTFY